MENKIRKDKDSAYLGISPSLAGYAPTNKEPFMNEQMKAYFKMRLENIRDEAQFFVDKYIQNELKENAAKTGDYLDSAFNSMQQDVNLSRYNAQLQLLNDSKAALDQLGQGKYGYCAVTGLPIKIDRLVANPITSLSLEAQALREKSKTSH